MNTKTLQDYEPELNRPLLIPTGAALPASPTGLVDRLNSWPVVIVSGVAFAAFAAVFFATNLAFSIPHVEEACNAPALDMRTYSTSDEVHQFLDDCGVAGRQAYRNLQMADLFYPAVSGLFFTSVLALAISRLWPKRASLRWLALTAAVGSGFDYLENLFAWRALSAFPNKAATDSLLGLASLAKTVSSWLAGSMLLAAVSLLALRLVKTRLTGRRQQRITDAGPMSDTGSSRPLD